MDDSGYYTRGVGDFQVCSPQYSAHDIFNLKFSELHTSEYSCFLHGFTDERDFEEFKQDLKDFQRLKRECCYRFVDDGDDAKDELIDLSELQFICKPNFVCRSRRGYASRRAKQCSRVPVIPAKTSLWESPTVVQVGLTTADSPSHMKHRTSWKDGSRNSLTGHVDREANCLGCDRSEDVELSIGDILMEFLNGDEHFLEFEQVFEAVRNRRISRDIDTCQLSHQGTGSRMSSQTDTSCRMSSQTDTSCRMSSQTDMSCRMSSSVDSGPGTKLDSTTGNNSAKETLQSSLVSDIFADFFDNDVSFLEFEKEFEQFRCGRRSYLLEGWHVPTPTKDIFADLTVSCARDVRPYTSNGSCSQNDLKPNRSVLYSAKDWAKMIRKIRRSSCISMEAMKDKRLPRLRHSVGEMSADFRQTEEPHSAHSLSEMSADFRQTEEQHSAHSLSEISADFRQTEEQHNAHSLSEMFGFNKHTLSPSSSQELSEQEVQLSKQVTGMLLWQPPSHSIQDMPTLVSDFSRQSLVTPIQDESSFTDSFDNGKDISGGQCAVVSDNHSRSSSPGHDCSSSCFCQTDLFIEEAGDKPQADSSPRHPPCVRSFSLMDLGSRSHTTDFRLHTNSLDGLQQLRRFRRSGSPLTGSLQQRISRRNTKYFGDDDLDDSLSMSPPSASCSHLSDVDSEHYHTATSDLSWGYSTAKSNLSHLIDRLECARLDLSDKVEPNSDSVLSDYVFDRSEIVERRTLPRDHYISYRTSDDWASCRDKRPRSASACQYTCHDHCVPAVTLSCKSVSTDGCDIAAVRTPSPPDPRSQGETCLFMGNLQARPGAARIVSSRATDTPATAHTSESAPNFQHLAQGRGVAGHMDTPRPPHIPIHHRSWSISEDIVTPHSYPIQHPGVISDPGRHSSPAPYTSSPPRLSKCSDSRFDSFPRGNTTGQSQQHTGAPRTQSQCVGEGSVLSQHARGGDRPAEEAPTLDLSDVHRRVEDTSPEAATEKDETDSGYRSGTIPDDKLPRVPSQATLDQQELKRKVAKFNHFVPAACLEVEGKESFQGFLKVTMNLVRPITMELGARPPSIYELLTREHIVEESTQQVAFYMPRDTHKSLHITSDTTTKEVIASLLKKFHILDHPRKFAMYEQEFNDRNKLVRLRRLTDKDCPLMSLVTWDPERIKNYRMVLQENETGEIVWDAFSLPELNNFLRVLDREEKETVIDLKYKYAYMKQYMERRLVELRGENSRKSKNKT